jgi:hypothetical protein
MKKLFELSPFTPVPLNLRITGAIDRTDHQLSISYELAGDLSRILIPTITTIPSRRFELWEATCLEFFLAPVGEDYYWEFNLSPSGDWNVFRLDNYRQGLENEQAVVDLPLTIKQLPALLTLELQFDLRTIVPENQVLEMAITTVIQDQPGDYSYWSLQHTAAAADFHHRPDFVMKIS